MADKYRNSPLWPGTNDPGSTLTCWFVARGPRSRSAPHGGGIEPGTSEIADAIGGERGSFYTFGGLKSSGTADLHITSIVSAVRRVLG